MLLARAEFMSRQIILGVDFLRLVGHLVRRESLSLINLSILVNLEEELQFHSCVLSVSVKRLGLFVYKACG